MFFLLQISLALCLSFPSSRNERVGCSGSDILGLLRAIALDHAQEGRGEQGQLVVLLFFSRKAFGDSWREGALGNRRHWRLSLGSLVAERTVSHRHTRRRTIPCDYTLIHSQLAWTPKLLLKSQYPQERSRDPFTIYYTKHLQVSFILQRHQRAQGGLARFFFKQEARDSLLGRETLADELEKEC